MIARAGQESGAALIGVLLVTILAALLVVSTLTVATGEIIIAGIQRDAVRALEQAHAGREEAVRRMEHGYPFVQGFSGSLSNTTKVSFVRLAVGSGSAYQEIQVRSTVGRATRRIAALVLQRSTAVLPDTVVAGSIVVEDGGQIACGDVYALTYIRLAGAPMTGCPGADPAVPVSIYAGWRIADDSGSCGSHDACVLMGRPSWFAGQRRSVPADTDLGAEIAAQTGRCLPGQGGLPDEMVSGTLADGSDYTGPAFGFDLDDPDGGGSVPPQAVHAHLPCGLPYKIVPQTFLDDEGRSLRRLVKTIVYEQWLETYWRFDDAALTTVKRAGAACASASGPCLSGGREPDLVRYPQYGAVPPFPEFGPLEENVDRRVRGGGRIGGGDFGCLRSEMQGDVNCSGVPANASRPIAVLLDDGAYILDGTLRGHGTLIVDGAVIASGEVAYWGAVVAREGITLEGQARFAGTVAAGGLLWVRGTSTVTAGRVPSVPVGRAAVTTRSWWER